MPEMVLHCSAFCYECFSKPCEFCFESFYVLFFSFAMSTAKVSVFVLVCEQFPPTAALVDLVPVDEFALVCYQALVRVVLLVGHLNLFSLFSVAQWSTYPLSPSSASGWQSHVESQVCLHVENHYLVGYESASWRQDMVQVCEC